MAEEKKEQRGFKRRLMDAMKTMENPTKDKTATVPTKSGKSYQYNYETLDQVLGVVRPALADNDLMLTQRQRKEGEGYVLETIVFDADEQMVMDERPIPKCSDAQQAGSWETYMRRYALRTAFGLTGEDDDGAATKGAEGQNPALNRKSGANGSVFDDSKVTEMASDKQMNMIHAKLNELAGLKGVTKEEATNGLVNSKTMGGADIDNLTKQQASDAITLLIKWVEDSKPVDDPNDLHDEDVDF